MKIIIAGAGIGGLYAAHLFGKRGHDVTVYEKVDGLDSMRYDWHDDINPQAFTNLGLKLPEGSYPKKDWTFVSPAGYVLPMKQAEEDIDWTVERRPINSHLYSLAAEYAKVVFGREVKSAYLEDGKVSGVTFADGETEKCDLVIDSCGADSKVRKSLPETFGIEDVVPEDTFLAYRAFYDAVPDAPVAYTNKVYMKHSGEPGISWCIVDNDPETIDVLIGRVGKLDKETLDNALEALRKDNPVLGNKVKRGGIVCKIPVRRPLTVFVADGYAAIGDSACMTIPLIGSGIISSLYAAKYLFEAVGDSESAPIEKLWQYERKVYADFGARHCGVDFLKRKLLVMKNSDIDIVFKKKILSNSDMQKLSVGKLIDITFKDAVTKAAKAGLSLPRLVPLASVLLKTHDIAKVAASIPAEYDEVAVAKWANKLEKLF